MRVLVSGGCGFIGQHLSIKLVKLGYEVTVIDDLSNSISNTKNRLAQNGVTVHVGDLSADALDLVWGEQFDKIFHLAAQSSAEVSYYHPVLDIRSNSVSTLKLLEFASHNNVSKFILASSMNVYGANSKERVSEDTCPKPYSCYGVSKLAAEHYCSVFSQKGVNCKVARLFNTYGPYQNLENKSQGMISIYLSYLLKNEPILVKGSLDRFRDFVFVDDVVDALISISNYNGSTDIFNIGSGETTTVRMLIDTLLKIYGATDHKIIEDEGTASDIVGATADWSKAKDLLGWKPRVKLEDGLERFVKHYTKNTP